MGSRQERQAPQGLEGGRFFKAVDEALPVSPQEVAAKVDQQVEL